MLAEVSSRIAPPPWFQHLLGEHLVDQVRLADGGEAEAELARGSGRRLRRRWTGRAGSVGLRRRKFNGHMEFAPGKRSLPARSPSVGAQPTADQLSMPPEQGLWSGQRLTGGSEENAIGRLPAGSADLSLEHAQLVVKGQDLGAKPGVRTSVDGQGLQEEADNGVGKGEEHGGSIPEIGSTPGAGAASTRTN